MNTNSAGFTRSTSRLCGALVSTVLRAPEGGPRTQIPSWRPGDLLLFWLRPLRSGLLNLILIIFLVGVPTQPGSGPTLNAQGRDKVRQSRNIEEAGSYLNRAVYQYRGGFHQKARFYINIALRTAPRWCKSQAAYYKLESLLNLSEDRPVLATENMFQALRIQADPFLYYLLGNYNQEMRSPRQARKSYLSAADSYFGKLDLTRPAYEQNLSKWKVLRQALPFICPAVGQNIDRDPGYNKYLLQMRQNPFRDYEYSDSLWRRDLRASEAALAAYQALALGRIQGAGAEEQNRLQTYLSYARQNSFFDDITFRKMIPLLNKPENDAAHRDCILGLEQLERRELKKIERGSTHPARAHLKIIREQLRRVYYNRLAWFGNTSSFYGYGSFLIRNKRFIEALYIYRRALNLLPLKITNTTFDGELRIRVQIYRQLELTYNGLGRRKDANLLAVLARNLESYHNGTYIYKRKNFKNETEVTRKLIKKLLGAARQNLKNREGLLLLIEHARGTSPRKIKVYKKKLQERDQEYDRRELLSAFGKL